MIVDRVRLTIRSDSMETYRRCPDKRIGCCIVSLVGTSNHESEGVNTKSLTDIATQRPEVLDAGRRRPKESMRDQRIRCSGVPYDLA